MPNLNTSAYVHEDAHLPDHVYIVRLLSTTDLPYVWNRTLGLIVNCDRAFCIDISIGMNIIPVFVHWDY